MLEVNPHCPQLHQGAVVLCQQWDFLSMSHLNFLTVNNSLRYRLRISIAWRSCVTLCRPPNDSHTDLNLYTLFKTEYTDLAAARMINNICVLFEW